MHHPSVEPNEDRKCNIMCPLQCGADTVITGTTMESRETANQMKTGGFTFRNFDGAFLRNYQVNVNGQP